MVKLNTSLNFLNKIRNKIIVVHYSCSSIDENIVKISSIAVYDSSEEVTYNFSRNDQKNNSEKKLLEDFFIFLKKKFNEGFFILGFNNKKPHYGLQALKKRFSQLTNKKLLTVPNDKIYDLDALIKKDYPNCLGGLHILADANRISLNNFVMGFDEITLFEKNEFQKLNLSTYSKVNIIYKLFKLYKNKNLRISNEMGPGYELKSSGYNKQFLENLTKIEDMINIKNFLIQNPDQAQFLRNLLYINVITSMETYLSDAFIYNIRTNEAFLKNFVNTYNGFEKIKFTELITSYSDISNTSLKDYLITECLQKLKMISFHKLELTGKLYKNAFEVKFPNDLKDLLISVKKRHGLVHRNGKDENGKKIIIEIEDLREIIKNVRVFISAIESGLNKKISLFK